MSAVGQKRPFRDVRLTSGLPLTADVLRRGRHFAFGPIVDIGGFIDALCFARRLIDERRLNRIDLLHVTAWLYEDLFAFV
jgi:hypothetical protein